MDKKQINNFFQICYFPTSEGKHYMRQYIFTNEGKVLNVKLYKIKSDAIDFIRKKYPINQYKIYNTHTLDIIPELKMTDISLSGSELLNNNKGTFYDYKNYKN